MSAEQRRFFVEGLKAKIPVNVVTLNKLLNTQIGTTVLNDISAGISRKDQGGVQALRAALILGASSPEGLSVFSFIAAYPSKSLEIDVQKALAVSQSLNMAFLQTQQLMLAMTTQVEPSKVKPVYTLDPQKAGTAKVEILNLSLNDKKRDRNIPLDIYWSNSANIDKPVIVFSHGFGSNRTDLRYLAQHLASHGYVVAALEHIGSNKTSSELATKNKTQLLKPQEFLDRPRDISFVIDELAKLNQTANNPLKGKLATDKVMVVGYSFGGTTALALAGGEYQIESLKQSCEKNSAKLSLAEGLLCVAKVLPEKSYQLQDSRIKQIVALNPATSLLFGETGLTKVKIPTLILANSADRVTPALTDQIVGFTKIQTPKWLAGAVGATHLSVIDPDINLNLKVDPNTPFSSREITSEQSADVRKFVKAITLSTAAQLTPDASKYTVFLTPEYAQVLSTPLFPFSLVRQISVEGTGLIKN
jgi:predicted dienelactone hydrolase